MPQVHPTAVVDPEATIAEDVIVGPYCVISGRAELSSGTVLGSGVVVEGPIRIGRNCRILHHAVVGTPPQDLKYRGAPSLVDIGDSNTIREFVTINRATNEGEETRIGNDNLLMAYVHVAHNCIIGDNVILANAVNLAGHVVIDDNAIVGGVTPVHQFVKIGRHAFIGGGSRVPKDVPPYVRAAGNPLRVVGLNSVGLLRRGFPPDVRLELKRLHRLFYRSGLNTSQAVERATSELHPFPEVEHFLDFVRQSDRGISS
ncbi:MAG: acyl-ACP--UDP-N-acetylglucosamine O-acyltransferase [Candidatus Eiseniibacteriota bacterium]|nr:MAG: acyl-ACP--UDP-N-acetylglucosamine O-acyltransferase [Candidatus Eisenbacteria bacterium]